ncbi:MAG: hypothetical protein COB12_00445 [Flavobacterium sp.]|nr:MAG: hypothetical protein COB12_00445 [Flavobacterium sp.]
MKNLLLILFLTCSCTGVITGQNKVSIQLKQENAVSTVLVFSGIEKETKLNFNNLVSVRIKGGESEISGEYSYTNKKLYFTPSFPFEKGFNYEIRYYNKDTIISIPKAEKKAAFVTNIFPTTNHIPENLLRFYIYFSSPMREGDFLNYIHLYDENGTDLKGVFFDNQYELWNSNFTRLTILVDPGRVKTGLKANLELGRAFQKNKKYKLQINKNWMTLNGQILSNNYTKEFYGTTAELTFPKKENWKITLPKINSKDPLVINFGKTVDHVSVHQFIQIITTANLVVIGNVELKENESVMFFYPKEKWKKGAYQIAINSRFEDIVGNNLNGLFDHKMGTLKNEKEGVIEYINFIVTTL